MRKIIAIGGVPGTGKTTLMRNFIATIDDWEMVEPVKLLSCMYSKSKDCYIFGKYEEGEVFAGTDRLSMAVQPNAVEFLKSTQSNIIFEGDRLFNQSFLEVIMGLPNTDLQIVYLTAPQSTLESRYNDRGSEQSEKFLKGRETKYNNLLSNFELMSYITEFPNTNLEEQRKVLEFLETNFTAPEE